MEPQQMMLPLDPSLLERYRNIRDVVAAGVYQRGLKKVAGELDLAPGNLSVALADDTQRKFDIVELERYMQVTGDLTPLHYLNMRYLGDSAMVEANALKRIEMMLADATAVMAQFGQPAKATKSRR